MLSKDISVAKGENVLFSEHRYFFYITNEREMTADEVVAEARNRCNQENLIAQLKGQVRRCTPRSTRSSPTGPIR